MESQKKVYQTSTEREREFSVRVGDKLEVGGGNNFCGEARWHN